MSASLRADAALRALLQTQYDREPAVILDSPPGAGKTGAVERLAAQAMARRGERVMIAAQTNAQAFDLARRLAKGFPRLPFHLLHAEKVAPPEDLATLGNLRCVSKEPELPDAPCVVVGTSAKWVWSPEAVRSFDLLIVDEAYQLPEHRFLCIAPLASRVVLVGDPGQIDPVVTADTARWRSSPEGPQVSSPRALLARHPGVPVLRLPVSRRLVQSTVDLVQPAFYPELPFEALAAPGERGLRFAKPTGKGEAETLERLAGGESLVWHGLPEGAPGVSDPAVADAIAGIIERLFNCEASIWDHAGTRLLQPSEVGVVCAQVAQVAAVRERLPAGLGEVFVETADRFQGLEKAIMFAWHPLSGRSEIGAFQLNAGRLCVMLSRHRIGCVVVGRAGIARRLNEEVPIGERVLGQEADPVYEGWRAQRRILAGLGVVK